ncbi:hypothetical protein AURDEDRAFT_111132 [Auricularia subglabra TFB-10046 SS5]|nr:hypothetical protein AURDEDRAFT_111132 [Auricularia subglabra TFB-10046 SS5]
MSASTVNITVEDTSPLIKYEPASAWTDSPQDDALLQQSSSQSFRTTNQPGASATFTFKGTGIWIFGSNGPTHGQYTVRVDGGPEISQSGVQPAPVANAPLVRASGFSLGEHTVTITNAAAAALDIDYVVFETAASSPTTVDDAALNAGLTYLPDDAAWQQNARPFFSAQTSHFAQAPDVAFRYEFEGDAIGLFGSMSQAHSPYSVEIDGRKTSFVPTVSTFHASFFDSDLGPGKHQLTLSSDALDRATYVDFDFAQVFQAPTISAAGSTSPSLNPVASSIPANGEVNGQSPLAQSHRFTTVEIVGMAAGALLGLCLLIAAVVLCMKSRRKLRSHMPSFEYPFGGLGVMDRFKRAPMAETGSVPSSTTTVVGVSPFEKTKVDSVLPPMQEAPARPKLAPIVTSLPPAAKPRSAPAPKPVPTVALPVPPVARPAPAVKPAAARKAVPVITSTAAAARQPAVKAPVPSAPVPVSRPSVRVPTSARSESPAFGSQKQVARKAPPQITSTAAAAIGSLPQRPTNRPPPIVLEPDVQGPQRPSRPQTLIMTPAETTTVKFGESAIPLPVKFGEPV